MVKKSIIFVLLIIWFFLAVISVGYNTFNIGSEVKNWYFLSDMQKREKIFGDFYGFSLFIDKHTTQKSSILVVSKEGFPFYLSRYYLYPKKIAWVQTPKDILLEGKESYEYIVSYSSPLQKKEYILEAVFTNKNKIQKGFLYKKK